MARLRHLPPEAHWFVTVRCAGAQHRLLPTPERNALFGYLVAKANERTPGIKLHAVVQMSNHFHLVLTDTHSELSTFMEYLDGQLAKELNELDCKRGQVIERRFSAIPILDEGALQDRIVYTINNPVAADLVRAHREWPGLVLWYGNAEVPIPFQRFRERAYRYALASAQRSGSKVNREDFIDRANLVLVPDGVTEVRDVRRAIYERQAALAQERQGPVLGAERVLEGSPFDSPEQPKRSPMPLCHTSCRLRRAEFREHWRALVGAYRRAADAFRTGCLDVTFPPYTFRPWLPLVGSSG